MISDKSARLFERGRNSVPSGTHSNSRAAAPHPLYFSRAKGGSLWDVDGNEWTDFVMGNGAVMLGHGDARVTEAVTQALHEGLGAGVESELSISAAERFLKLVRHAEQVRFTNTGTEAAIHAVHIARAVTGKSSIAKVEGAYHGWWDEVFVSTWPDLSQAGSGRSPLPLPGGGGLREDAVKGTVVVPFNDLEATREILTAHKDRLSAFLIEPTMIDIGFVPADDEYLHGLRDLTNELGILLIFDELLTGFRLANGGAQEKYGIQADLSLWGKALGNGFPIAALAGKREFMERSAPGPGNAPFVGTFNGYRPGLAACVATLDQLEDGQVLEGLERRSQDLIRDFNASAKECGVPAQLHAGGGHFQPYFTEQVVKDYRSAATTDAKAYDVWQQELSKHGIIVAPKALLHSAFSASHTDDALNRFLEVSRQAFIKISEEKHD